MKAKADDLYIQMVADSNGEMRLVRLMQFTDKDLRTVEKPVLLMEIKEARALASFIIEALDAYEAQKK